MPVRYKNRLGGLKVTIETSSQMMLQNLLKPDLIERLCGRLPLRGINRCPAWARLTGE